MKVFELIEALKVMPKDADIFLLPRRGWAQKVIDVSVKQILVYPSGDAEIFDQDKIEDHEIPKEDWKRIKSQAKPGIVLS